MGKVLSKPSVSKKTRVGKQGRFHHAVEVVEGLTTKERVKLVDYFRKREIAARQDGLVASAKRAKEEYDRGDLVPMTAEEAIRALKDA